MPCPPPADARSRRRADRTAAGRRAAGCGRRAGNREPAGLRGALGRAERWGLVTRNVAKLAVPPRGSHFSSGRKVDYALRARVNRSVGEQARAEAALPGPSRQRSFRSDQGAVWSEISAREIRAGSASPKAALHDLYAQESDDLAAFIRAFPCPPGANGLEVGIGGKLVALEVFDAPETLAAQWNRLVEGAASAHLDHRRAIAAGAIAPPGHRHPDPGALRRMLERTAAALAAAVVSPSVGEGSDIRLAGTRVSGSALAYGDRVVHLELFRVEA